LHLVVHIVEHVNTISKKEHQIVLAVVWLREDLSGENASYTLVLQITKLSIVECVRTFHVTCLSTSLIQNMGKRVLSQELDSWRIERKQAQNHTLRLFEN